MCKLFQLCFLSFLLAFVGIAISHEDDIEKRISSFSIRASNQLAANILTKTLKGRKIPNQKGAIGDVKYWLTSLMVSSFSCPRNAITLKMENKHVILKGKNVSAGVKGKFRYKYDSGWIHLKDNGRFSLKIRRMSVNFPLKMKSSKNGKITITAGTCSCDVGSVSMKFYGGTSWIYNLFKGFIEKKLETFIEKEVCKALVSNVNKFASVLKG